jgi:UDP-N-acetyl-D-mannosaminuronic acid dehydrogenase
MKKRVCVSGLGNVGLPTACILATSGYLVHGVDSNEKVVSRVNSGNLANYEAGLCDLLIKAIEIGHLEASTNVKPADFHIIAVPTLLGPGNEHDIA